jgi:nucleolar protein 14
MIFCSSLGNADILGAARFGGFRDAREGAQPGQQPSTWKERLEEMITATRQKRAMLQKEKDGALDMTEKLDAEWKGLSEVLHVNVKKDDAEKEKEKSKLDDYDLLVNEFKISARAQVIRLFSGGLVRRHSRCTIALRRVNPLHLPR